MESVRRLVQPRELKNLLYAFIYVHIPDFLMFVVDWVLRNYFDGNLQLFYVILGICLCYHGVLNLWKYLSAYRKAKEQKRLKKERRKEAEASCQDLWKRHFKRLEEIAKHVRDVPPRRTTRRLRVSAYGNSIRGFNNVDA